MKKSISTIPIGILPKSVVGHLSGKETTLKAHFCSDLFTTICSKRNSILGMKIHRSFGSAIYVKTVHSDTIATNNSASVYTDEKEMCNNLRFLFGTDNLIVKLEQELSRAPADLIIVDNFNDLFKEDMQDKIALRNFFKPFKKLAKKFNCLILFNHEDEVAIRAIIKNKTTYSRTALLLKVRPDLTKIITVIEENNNHSVGEPMYLTFTQKKVTRHQIKLNKYRQRTRKLLSQRDNMMKKWLYNVEVRPLAKVTNSLIFKNATTHKV